jgi:hypothetical protein
MKQRIPDEAGTRPGEPEGARAFSSRTTTRPLRSRTSPCSSKQASTSPTAAGQAITQPAARCCAVTSARSWLAPTRSRTA